MVRPHSTLPSAAVSFPRLPCERANLIFRVGFPELTPVLDCQNELVELLQSLAPELRNFASDGNPDALCASADHLCLQIPQLVDATRGLASYSGANAKKLLAQAKNLAGAMQRLANECYTGGPNTEKYNAEACSAVGMNSPRSATRFHPVSSLQE